MKKRLLFILLVFSILLTALAVRAGWIQLVQGDFFQRKAFEQQIHARSITPKRGTIYDRNYKELAVSASAEDININPAEITEKEKVAQKLSEYLQMDYDLVLKKVNAKSRLEFLKKRVDKDAADKIREWIANEKIQGVYVDEGSKRYYPGANLASHILGFTGKDNQGLWGIEMVLDQELKGKPGRIIAPSDAKGREITSMVEKYLPPEDGLHAVLTIDETIQHFAESALETAMVDNKVVGGGAVVVMNPKTGEILALASKPDFDSNDPYAAPPDINKDTWKGNTKEDIEKLTSTVWRNKAVSDAYEPGSTFKTITVSSALEEKVTSLEDKFFDKGYLQVGGHTIHCWKTQGHGSETLAEGLYNSCNPVMMELAARLGVDRFYKYVRAFGFNEKTGILLNGEASGLFHNLKNVGPVELATASFGQRFEVTPLQMVTAVSAIANGGKLMKPLIVKELVDSQGNIVKKYEPETVRQVISPETSAIMREIMEGVVSKGTGKNGYVKGYRVAGKTGTSEKKLTDDFIGSFIGFAPADDPMITVLMVLDSPKGPLHQGSQTAAPAVANIIDNTMRYLKVEPRYTEKDNIVVDTVVPDVRNKTIDEAKNILVTQFNLVYKVEGGGNTKDTVVVDQTPKPYAKLPEKSTVILYTTKQAQETMVKVPNLLKKTVPEAKQSLDSTGLNIREVGLGVAVKQSHQPGSLIPKGTLVTVEFRYLDDVD